MVPDIVKWLKETSFYENKKKIIIRTWTLHKWKVHIKKKERVYEFFELRKNWYYRFLGVKRYLFQRRKLVKRWSFFRIYETSMML